MKKYLNGDSSPSENREVFNWIKQSVDNEKEFKLLRRLNDIAIWSDCNVCASVAKSRLHIIKSTMFRVASVLLLGIILVFSYHNRKEIADYLADITSSDAVEMEQVTVPSGEQMKLLLSDGTKVWLNSKSTLTYPSRFDRKNRTVELKGEAYFDVFRDTTKVFKVLTPNYTITVLGTEFNVKTYDNNLFETALLRGSVEVESTKDDAVAIRLEADQAIVDKNNVVVLADVREEDFLWREGILFIDNKTVADIIPIMNQYYDVDLKIENRALLNTRYTGKFRICDGVEQILKVFQIQNDFAYHVQEDGSTIIIE